MQPAITMSFSINLPTAEGAADLMADLAAAFAKLQRYLGAPPAPAAAMPSAPVSRGAVAPLPPPAPDAPSDAPAAPLPQPAPAAEAPKRGRPKLVEAKPAEAPAKPVPVEDVAPAQLSDDELIVQLRNAGNKLIGKGKAADVASILAKLGAKRYPDLSTADKVKALAALNAAIEAVA